MRGRKSVPSPPITEKSEEIMKYQDIIEKMTIEEKAAFLSGKGEWQTRDFERLGIPPQPWSDTRSCTPR